MNSLGVGQSKDVDCTLAEAREDLADVHRHVRRDVLVKVPTLVVDRRRRNAVPVVVVQHAVFRNVRGRRTF